MDRLGFIKIKKTLFCKRQCEGNETQDMNWKKYIFTNHRDDKRFVPRIYKELLKFNNMKANNRLKVGQCTLTLLHQRGCKNMK